MDRCAVQTRSVEVHYSNGEQLLTKVYFPHTTNVGTSHVHNTVQYMHTSKANLCYLFIVEGRSC